MIKNYRISEKAILDLEKIWFYTFNKWSKEQADRYHRLIIEEINFMEGNYGLCRNMEHIRRGYRMSKVKSHLIFCKKVDNGLIEVVRILHQNMDIENRLNE